MPEPRAIPLSSDGVEVVIDLSEPKLYVPGFVGERYDLDGTHEVIVFGPHDRIVAELIDIEVAQLVALGDRPEDARDWLANRDGAAWLALFEAGAEQVAGHVLGLIRVTVGPRGYRSLKDLSVLLGVAEEAIILDTRRRFGFETLGGTPGIIDVTTLDLTPYGCSNRNDLVGNLERLARAALISIVRSAQMDGSEIVVTLQNPVVAKLLQRLGWPLRDLDLGEMSYQLFPDHETPMATVFTWGYTAEAGPQIDAEPTAHFRSAKVALLGNGRSLQVPDAITSRWRVASVSSKDLSSRALQVTSI